MTRRKRYNLSELVSQCDPNASMPPELEGWESSPAVGREWGDSSEMISGMVEQCIRLFDTGLSSVVRMVLQDETKNRDIAIKEVIAVLKSSGYLPVYINVAADPESSLLTLLALIQNSSASESAVLILDRFDYLANEPQFRYLIYQLRSKLDQSRQTLNSMLIGTNVVAMESMFSDKKEPFYEFASRIPPAL